MAPKSWTCAPLSAIPKNMRYWLMKSEPDVFSIDDLQKKKTSLWDGVRNYQARNFMTQDMQIGDQVLFYHSNAEPPGVAGLAEIVGGAEPDPSQFDKKSEYFDPKASPDKPRWFCVRVGFKEKFENFVPLETLRTEKPLKNMLVIKIGQRLSIQPVQPQEFECIRKLSRRP
jgi:predicted RNA-binding protein with PUA-like domain